MDALYKKFLKKIPEEFFEKNIWSELRTSRLSPRLLKMIIKIYKIIKRDGLLRFLANIPGYFLSGPGRKAHVKFICYFLPFILRFAPWSLSFFIGNRSKYRRLPRYTEKIPLSEDCMDDFLFVDFNFACFDEVNLVMRGEGADHHDINKELPTFFLNVKNTDFMDHYSNYCLMTGDLRVLARYLGWSGFTDYINGEDKCKICYVAGMDDLSGNDNSGPDSMSEECVKKKIKKRFEYHNMSVSSLKFDLAGGLINKFGVSNFQIGSGLAAVIVLLNISKKVNVFGWDQYLEKSPPTDFLGQVRCLCQKKGLVMSNVITSLINWMYAFRLLKEYELRISVHGHVDKVRHFDWIPDLLYPVIYRSCRTEKFKSKKNNKFFKKD